MNDLKKMNLALYNAAVHLMEAGKYMSNVPQEPFQQQAAKFIQMADDLAAIIKPEPEKVSDEKMKSIMDEIMNFGEDNEGKE